MFSRGSQVPKVFPNVFPKMFPIAPWVIYPYGLPKVQLPCIETKQVASGDAHLFLFCNWGSKEVLLLGGMPKVPKELLMGQSINMANSFLKRKKSCEPTTHDLINMWIFYARSFLGCFQPMNETMSEKSLNVRKVKT